MIRYEDGICYIDLGCLSSKDAKKMMEDVWLGEFSLQVFMSKVEWKETDELRIVQ